MAITNKSFEIAGVLPGWAQDWTIAVSYAGEIVADFSGGIGDPTSTDRFLPGWNNDDYQTTIVSGAPAAFDAGLAPSLPHYEGFGRWIGDTLKIYRTSITGGTAAPFSGSSGVFTTNTFDVDWGNTPYLSTITGGSTVADTMESGWGNDVYLSTITGGTAAEFTDGNTVEYFSPLAPDVLFTVNPTNLSLFMAVGHALVDGQKVTITTTGTYPGGLAQNTTYYVIEVDPDTFSLSISPGPGAAVYADTVGNGDHYIHADPEVYWTVTA